MIGLSAPAASSLPPDTVERVLKEEGRSMSQFLREAIRLYRLSSLSLNYDGSLDNMRWARPIRWRRLS